MDGESSGVGEEAGTTVVVSAAGTFLMLSFKCWSCPQTFARMVKADAMPTPEEIATVRSEILFGEQWGVDPIRCLECVERAKRYGD